MCGFVGELRMLGTGAGVRPHDADSAALLRACGRQLERRGPDDDTLFVQPELCLNFRRLSILDLEHGTQPFEHGASRLTAWVNGEIYNHRELREGFPEYPFRSRSDGEVVLPLYQKYGLEFVEHLSGMFAVCLWDAGEKKLVLARDRLGIKPLYFTRNQSRLIFASEPKAILAHRDYEPVLDFKRIGLRGSGSAAFVGLEEVAPARVEVFSTSRDHASRRYWDLEAIAVDEATPSAPAISRCAELVESSVRARLMGDVPLGTFLSGGVDSSLITAIAAKQEADLHAFCLVDESTLEVGDVDSARRAADHCGAQLHLIDFRGPEFWSRIGFGLESLEYFVWLMDRSHFSLEFLFKHELHRVASREVPRLKIMLSGQGADEFSGGYSAQQGLGGGAASWQDYVERLDRDLPLALKRFCTRTAWEQVVAQRGDVYASTMRGWATTRLSNYNLWVEDRVASGQSHETRVPFLDHHLVEHLYRVAPAARASLFWNKEIYRQAAEGWLPREVCRQPKHPFVYTPNDTSSRTHSWHALGLCFPDFLEKYASSSDCLLDAEALRSYYQQLGSRKLPTHGQIDALWQVLALEIQSRLVSRLRSAWTPQIYRDLTTSVELPTAPKREPESAPPFDAESRLRVRASASPSRLLLRPSALRFVNADGVAQILGLGPLIDEAMRMLELLVQSDDAQNGASLTREAPEPATSLKLLEQLLATGLIELEPPPVEGA